MSRYLLDVNVLLALSDPTHVHHSDAHIWLATLGEEDRWLTTPITEAALARLLMNPVIMGVSISAQTALAQLEAIRHADKHEFLADSSSLTMPSIGLGSLVGYRQVTDFHLVNLAAGDGALFATFDHRITKTLVAKDAKRVVIVPSTLGE